MKKAFVLRILDFVAFTFTALGIAIFVYMLAGCTEGGDTYISPMNPCCADGCTTPDHSDPCHPDCLLTGDKFTICLNGTTMKILKTDWESYKARGAVKGKCPRGDDDDDDNGDDDDDDDGEEKVCICHVPPGNPANAHTICIGASAVPAHLANHDDYLGECND